MIVLICTEEILFQICGTSSYIHLIFASSTLIAYTYTLVGKCLHLLEVIPGIKLGNRYLLFLQFLEHYLQGNIILPLDISATGMLSVLCLSHHACLYFSTESSSCLKIDHTLNFWRSEIMHVATNSLRPSSPDSRLMLLLTKFPTQLLRSTFQNHD